MHGSVFSGTWITGLKDGRKVIASAGTREPLFATEESCSGVIIQALRTNATNIAVGGYNVNVSTGSEAGIILTPGQSETMFTNDASKIYIDAITTGDGVSFTVMIG